MNLYELQKEIKKKKCFIEQYKREIERYEEMMFKIKTSNIEADMIHGGKRRNNLDICIDEITYRQERIKDLKEELELYEPLIKDLEQILKDYNDIEQLIYFERKVLGYSVNKISQRHHYGKSQIYNIINKVEERLVEKTLEKIGNRLWYNWYSQTI